LTPDTHNTKGQTAKICICYALSTDLHYRSIALRHLRICWCKHRQMAQPLMDRAALSMDEHRPVLSGCASAVTIFIATFQNYRIVSLSRYFLCMRNDIFARHLCYASMIDSPPVYSSFSTLQSRAANNLTRVIAVWRPWLSSVFVRERRCNCL